MRFDIIVDLAAPIPEFLIKRAKKIVLDVALDRLRSRVTRNHGSEHRRAAKSRNRASGTCVARE